VEPPKTPVQVPVPTATNNTVVRPVNASPVESNPAVRPVSPAVNDPPVIPATQTQPDTGPPPRTALQAQNTIPARPNPTEVDIPPLGPTSHVQGNLAARPNDKPSPSTNRPVSTQQCPTGTRLVGMENGVTVCSFD
jgi:hypothetical protein